MNNYLILLIIFLYLIKYVISSFKSLKRISENGDYLVILDNGLYIYNFAKLKCRTITNYEASIFKSNEDDNYILISDKEVDNSMEIKIAVLINKYLYIISFDGNDDNLINLVIQNLSDEKIYPFNVQVDGYNLIINYIKKDRPKHSIESFHFNDYLSITDNNRQTKKYDDEITNRPICKLDNNSSLIKCIYVHFFDNHLYFLSIDISNYKYKKVQEINIEETWFTNYEIITLTFSRIIDLVCLYRNSEIVCYFKQNSGNSFTKINYNFGNQCSKFNTYYFEEKNEFFLVCKKTNGYYLYIFDGNNMNNIKIKIISIDNYNGKMSVILNQLNNNYDIVYDRNFTETCEEYNQEEKSIEIIISAVQEIIETTNINIFNSYKTEIPSTNMNISDFIKLEDTIISYQEETNQKNKEMNDSIHIENESEIIIISEISNITEINTYKINDMNITLETEINKENLTNAEMIRTELKEEYLKKTDFIYEIEINKEETNITKEGIIENIINILENKEIGKSYEINGADFKITIKPTNSNIFENVTHIEFDDCERILRKYYNISNSSIITFFQMEINNEKENALYNQIKYFTYDDQKKELDLSLCEDIETKIHYMIKNDSKLDTSTINEFKNIGVDIFNIRDVFFTDICYSYSDSDNDMILEDRIKYIYQNYSLCEEGCTYNNIDIEKMSITCDCKIQGNFSTITTPLIYDQINEVSYLDSNIAVAKCYNLVFTLKNKHKNIGFILLSILFLIYLIFLIYFLSKGMKPISDFLLNEMRKYGYLNKNVNIFSEKKNDTKTVARTKIVKKIKKKIKIKKKMKIHSNINNKINIETKDGYSKKEKDNKSLFLSNIQLKNVHNNFLSSNIINKDPIYENEDEVDNYGIIKIKLNEDIKKYSPKDSNQTLHNYTYKEAIEYDRRNIFRIFYIYLLSKQIIFHTFFQRNPLELFSLRFTLFIFIFYCDLALNSLFYLNDNISKKYHYAKNLFLFAFSNNITIIIYSTLLSYALVTLMTKLINLSNSIRKVFRKEEEKIKNKKGYIVDEKTKNEIILEVKNILRKYKIRLIFVFIFEIMLILFFWYFVTAFCQVYSSTQTSWLLDSFLSILSRFFVELIFAFFYSKLYQISVGSNIETLYKIVMCLYDFS